MTTSSKFQELVSKRKVGWQHYFMLFWALIGPGFIAAMADNDAGGVISYVLTGAHFGIGLFVPLALILAPLTYTVQELSMRLSVVTQEGFSRLAVKRYGRFWGFYHIITLALSNLLILMTEFIGMTAGLALLGVPMWLGCLICLILIVIFVSLAGYWTKERIALLLGALNAIFLVVAWMTHPNMAEIGHAFLTWNVPHALQGGLIFYVLATIGNAIAPWMLFFQGSGSLDKGVTSRELRFARIDTAFGAIISVIISAGIILVGAALFGHVQDIANAGPSDIITSLNQVVGRWPAILFGFGLFNAGFLASITISLSSSWSIAGLFGWSKSLNNKITEAPGFYLIYIGSLVIAAGTILIPNLPLNLIAIATQVIGAILMVPLLIFMVMMTSNKELMGQYRTKLFGRIWGWVMVALLTGLSIAAIWQTFTSLLGV
jgi:Mn2+/Fe2+ NRAMP family transporter